MDALSLLLSRFSVEAGVFYAGKICGVHEFQEDHQHGHVHLIACGPVEFIQPHGESRVISEPTLLFLPRPEQHRLVADSEAGAQVLCATVRFGSGNNNPISESLPAAVLIPLAGLRGIGNLMELVRQESLDTGPGAQASLNCLCEVLMIQVLRYCLEQGLTSGGALAGLSDPRLAKALGAIHKEPTRHWDLPEMAAAAGMSRARFAAHFRAVTGLTPADYLAGWRVTVAKNLLKGGRPMKYVCLEAGYASSSAFTRAFTRRVGVPPGEWLKSLGTPGADPRAQAARSQAAQSPGESRPFPRPRLPRGSTAAAGDREAARR